MSQTQRTLAMLGALAVVAGGLGLYAYYGVMKTDDAESQRKEVSDHILPLSGTSGNGRDAGAIDSSVFSSLKVTAKGESTVLERNEQGQWALTAPVRAAVDKRVIDALVSQLQIAKFKDEVEAKPDEAALAKYGLKPPHFSVTAFIGSSGSGSSSTEFTLLGGIENTFDGTSYLQRQGEPAVYSAQGAVRYALEKTTFELREKELAPFDVKKVKAVEVKSPAGAYRAERGADKGWRLVHPFAAPADAATLESMLGALAAVRSVSFPVDTAVNRQALGLESAPDDATLELESGEKIRVRFAHGSTDAGMGTFGLREDGRGSVLSEVNAQAASVLAKPPSELKDRSVLSFKKEDAARISFRLNDGKNVVVARRSGLDGGLQEDWELLGATAARPAKKFKISSLLWTLGSLRASALGEEAPRDWTRWGVDARSRGVTLFAADGRELARLTIGKEVPGKSGTVYVRGTRNQVLEADLGRLAELPTSEEDLLDTATHAPGSDAGMQPGLFENQ